MTTLAVPAVPAHRERAGPAPASRLASRRRPADAGDDERLLEALQARSARGALPLQAPDGEPGDATALADTLGAEDPGIDGAETRAALDRLLRTLSPRAGNAPAALRAGPDPGRDRRPLRREPDAVSRILRETIAHVRHVADQAGALRLRSVT